MKWDFMCDGEMDTGFWLRNLEERDHLEDQGIDVIVLKFILKKYVRRTWTSVIWLWTGTCG
jgi:hypothetical protein